MKLRKVDLSEPEVYSTSTATGYTATSCPKKYRTINRGNKSLIVAIKQAK